MLQQEVVPNAIAVHVNLKSRAAYAAVPSKDGQVRPWYFLVDTEETDGEACVAFKDVATEESPSRWPDAVANVITRWYD